MVQAILSGQKTMTRRVVKDQPNAKDVTGCGMSCFTPDGKISIRGHRPDGSAAEWFRKGYGLIGDRLWVRETFQIIPPNKIFYKADKENIANKGWRPSIFMPRSASRITLEITGIKVERLQDISEEDAKREGVEKTEFGYKNYDKSYPVAEFMGGGSPARRSFMTLWESINGTGSWNANPWVWVIEFKRI